MRKSLLLVLVLFLLACCTYALADTEIALEPCAGKMSIDEEKYILLTPSNLSDHPDLVSSLGMSQEDLLADWEARGVQFQAWTKKMDSCLEVTVIQDEESAMYFDLEQKTRKERNEYLKLHKGSGRFAQDGFTILQPEWKKQKYGGNFLKFEYKRTVGEKTWRGFVRKTVRNGYTIMLDYQAFDRLPRRTDEDALNKIANTVSFEVKDPMQVAQEAAQQADKGEDGTAQSLEEISALKAGMINISVYPPDQTNSNTFTVEGTSTPGGVVTVVGMRIAKTEAHRFNAEVTSKGNFKVNVTLPEEGVWNFTIGLEADGKTYPYDNVKQTEYYASLLPVTLDTQFPAELTSDEMTISGTTDKGVTVQCIVQCNGSAILNKQVKTNGTGVFKFKVSTAVEGSYDFVLSFQKKGLNNVRKSFTSTRTLTAADNQARANTKAIHPAYKALMNNMDSYIGKTMVYSVHIVNVTNNTDQWVIQAALKKNKGTYSNFVYYIADTDPGLEAGTKVKVYGVFTGGYPVQSEEDIVTFPGFDYVSYE